MAKERDYEEIIKNKWIVEFDRKPFDKSKEFGFILDFNDKFTLIQLFDHDYFNTDGYCIFKNESVKKVRVYDKEEYFLYEVVKKKKIKPKFIPKVSIENWEKILQSVQENFSLVQIENELINKNCCYIGIIEKISQKGFKLKEIDPSANWDEIPNRYKYKDLTKVAFDSAYINTLWEISESRKEKL